MKKIISAFLVLFCLLSFFGCNADGGEISSSIESSDVTSSTEVVEYETVQSKFFGELKRGVDEEGYTAVHMNTDQWSTIKAETVTESLLDEYTAEFADICADCDYICLDLGAGYLSFRPSDNEVFKMFSPDIHVFFLSTPFNDYMFYAFQRLVSYNYHEVNGSVLTIKNPVAFGETEYDGTFSSYARLISFIRLIYGFKPTSISQWDIGSGFYVLATFIEVERNHGIINLGDYSLYDKETGECKWE